MRATATNLDETQRKAWKAGAQDAEPIGTPKEELALQKKAEEKAEQQNKETLKTAIKNAQPLAINAFLIHNSKAFGSRHQQQTIAITYDFAEALDKAKDKTEINKITKDLQDIAYEIVDEQDFTALNTKQFPKGYIEPEEIYAQLLEDENFKKGRNEDLKTSGKALTRGLNRLTFGIASNFVLGIKDVAFVAPANLYSANEQHKRHSRKHRNIKAAIGLSTILAAAACPFPGEWAEETFHKNAITAENMGPAYNFNPEVAKHGKLVAAFAAAFYTTTDNPNLDIALTSYLQAQKVGAKIIPTALTSLKETGFLYDTVANNSSAINLYQMVLKTKLEWLKRYHNQIDYNGDTLAEKSIKYLVNNYKKDKKGLIKKIQGKTIEPAHLLALQTADRPEVSAQLFALEAKRVSKEMNLNYGNPESLEDSKLTAAIIYAPHLLGEHGAAFLHYVIQKDPSIKMNDILKLNALYENYPGKDENFNAGEYYTKVAHNNQSVIKSSNITAMEYLKNVGNVVTESRKAETLLNDIQHKMDTNDTVWEILAKDKTILDRAVPNYTNWLELSAIKLSPKSWQPTIRSNVRAPINALSYIWPNFAQPELNIESPAVTEPTKDPETGTSAKEFMHFPETMTIIPDSKPIFRMPLPKPEFTQS